MVIKLSKDFIVERDGREFVDVVKILPESLSSGKKFSTKFLDETKVEIYIPSNGLGHDSKKFILNRFIELDDLFFEGLGLWEGEGGKGKGLYFGNSCLELILHFLEFCEQKLGIERENFKVTVNISKITKGYDCLVEISKTLKIPLTNFTNFCYDLRLNYDYSQLYINGMILLIILQSLHERIKFLLTEKIEYSVPYLRGLFAAEGSVLLKKWGTISHLDFSSNDQNYIEFLRKILSRIDIQFGKYIENGRKIQIYNRKQFQKFKELKLHCLHPEKSKKFERGFNNYKREVKKRPEMISSILSCLSDGPKTYDNLTKELMKGRSTIQSHYIPIMEKKGFVRKCGKIKQAWLFEITEKGKDFLSSLNNKNRF